jgi:hypothetical protein
VIYWLFTDGRELLGCLIIPLSGLALLMPLVVSVILGAGIQRSSEAQRSSGWKRGLLLFTHGIVLLGVAALYLTLLNDAAVQPMRGGQSTSPFVRSIVGGPPNIDHMRLFGFGVMLLFVWTVVSTGLRNGLRNGGWLRERVDRMRTPKVRRGALGSSHFCSQREYKRFRREDPEGLTLLGAFWGENEEGRLENRVLGLLRACGGSATLRDIYRALRSPRKPVLEALKALEQDGQVERFLAQGGERGRQPEAYRLTTLSVTVRDT